MLVISKEIEELKRITRKRRDDESLSRRLKSLIELRNRERQYIIEQISLMKSALYRTVLIARYVNDKSVISIAQMIHYSESRTYEILRDRERELKL